jgi:4-hydroxy-tetrahydrodipicolinate reductase
MAAGAAPPPLIRAVLIGVTGRMGLELLRAAPGFAQLIVTGAIASPESLALGRDAGELAGLGRLNLAVTSDLPRALEAADVALDFSSAAATRANLAACRAARKPLLIGTTGFAAELDGAFVAAARDIALLIAANTSLGVTLLLELVRIAARALPASFDINILDTHHRSKQDAPSGTALALGAAACEARQAAASAAGGRGAAAATDKPRRAGEVGFASVRAGDIVGEHTVLFAGPGEALSLTHRATDRGVFARGALAAALWLQSRPPGRYTMRDLLAQKTAT